MKVFASREINNKLKANKQSKLMVYSFFPIDRAGCACQKLISEWKNKLLLIHPKDREGEVNKVKYITCPRDKTNMQHYKIVCKNCNEILAYVWATDKSLTDFCDLHYVNWTDGEQWYGCLTPNISPIDEYLGLQCCCGQDTRDFRANRSLPSKIVADIEDNNKRGRLFGRPDSKFKVLLA